MIRSSILGLALGFAISGISHAQNMKDYSVCAKDDMSCVSPTGLIEIKDDYPMVWKPRGTEHDPVYVQIIVTACPPSKDLKKLPKTNAMVTEGFWPINQGKSYENEKSMTKAERIEYFKKEGCVEVPIPMEYVQTTSELTMGMCASKIGYFIAMQYLEQDQEYKKSKPYVGMWACIPSTEPFVGVTNQ